MRGTYRNKVGLYQHGRYESTVAFKRKWQARLFHLLLNRSLNHAGTREY